MLMISRVLVEESMRLTLVSCVLVLGLLAISGCAREPIQELKSPCVSADTGAPGAQDPCGPKRNINASWLNG